MKSRDWAASSNRVAVAVLVVVSFAGCGPTLYQHAYTYCLQRGGADYECDRFARDEANHAQQQTAEQITRGQQAISPAARPKPYPTPKPTLMCRERGQYLVCE